MSSSSSTVPPKPKRKRKPSKPKQPKKPKAPKLTKATLKLIADAEALASAHLAAQPCIDDSEDEPLPELVEEQSEDEDEEEEEPVDLTGLVGWQDFVGKPMGGSVRDWHHPAPANAPKQLGPTNLNSRHFHLTPGKIFQKYFDNTICTRLAEESTA